MNATALYLLPPFLRPSNLPTLSTQVPSLTFLPPSSFKLLKFRRPDLRVWADDGDADGGADEYDMDDDEVEEVDNKKNYDVEYDPLSGGSAGDDEIAIIKSKSFVSTQGWDSKMIVDYRINEEEFHKISLMHCDF